MGGGRMNEQLTIEEINLIQELIEYRQLGGESMTFEYRERLSKLRDKIGDILGGKNE
jgi:hypothetical protein